jgi:uncharacterized protein YecE (DUF72 family)
VKELVEWKKLDELEQFVMSETGSLYLGTSGLVLPYRNRQDYPPELEGQSRIAVYGKFFNSIEVNSIFYKLPRTATVAQWAGSVGKDFRFTFKLWKQITHSPGLNFSEPDLDQYFKVIDGAGEKRGSILVQFPASVKPPLFKKVDSLLANLQERNLGQWAIAVEFRSSLWYTGQTYDMLNAYNAAIVFHDKSDSESPQPELDASNVYLRFHGPGGNYKGSYDQGLLYEYAGYVAEWLAAGKTVYVYFNNTMGAALDNLRTLERFLKEDFSNE